MKGEKIMKFKESLNFSDSKKLSIANTLIQHKGTWSKKSLDLIDEVDKYLLINKDRTGFSTNFKDVYNNIFKTLELLVKIDSWTYVRSDVAFGFVYNPKTNTFKRCAYLIDKLNRDVIDVNSVIFNDIELSSLQRLIYIPFKIFKIGDYFNLFIKPFNNMITVIKTDFTLDTSLKNFLLEDETLLHNELVKKGYKRDYDDFIDFCNRLEESIK